MEDFKKLDNSVLVDLLADHVQTLASMANKKYSAEYWACKKNISEIVGEIQLRKDTPSGTLERDSSGVNLSQ
jgi:hypothetical protein